MVFASRSKRCFRSGSSDRCDGSTLIATVRSSRASRARYTSPMPPAPSGAIIWYGPSRVPAGIPISPLGSAWIVHEWSLYTGGVLRVRVTFALLKPLTFIHFFKLHHVTRFTPTTRDARGYHGRIKSWKRMLPGKRKKKPTNHSPTFEWALVKMRDRNPA